VLVAGLLRGGLDGGRGLVEKVPGFEGLALDGFGHDECLVDGDALVIRLRDFSAKDDPSGCLQLAGRNPLTADAASLEYSG